MVGTIPFSRAKWLLGVPKQNIRNWEDWEDREIWKLIGQLYFFTYPNCLSIPAVELDQHKWRKWFERWHRRISLGISKLERGRSWVHHLVTPYSFWVPREHHCFETPNVLTFKSTLKDNVAHMICMTLTEVNSCLRRCPRVGCRELFIQQGRQRYCSTRCGQTERTRQHRIRHSTVKMKIRQEKKEDLLKVKLKAARVQEAAEIPWEEVLY